MSNDPTPRLSDLISASDAASDRRTFLTRASALSLAIPGMAALSACDRPDAAPSSAAPPAKSPPTQYPDNSNSRLDSTVVREEHHANTSVAGVANDASAVTYHRYAPELPPPPANGRLVLHWHAREVPVRITDDVVVSAWTFEGDVPGPILHCRVGDTIEFTLTNDVVIPHSIDFHGAQIDPKVAFRSVPKGESVTFTFTPKYAGAFMYHCGTAPVLMHIGAGMYGALIVSPREGLPPAKEFVLVQGEYYLSAGSGGVQVSDYQKMLSTLPDHVCFNGRPGQYMKEPIRVKVGDRVRFWVVAAGPSHPCHFHVVGEQFDSVWLGAPPANPIRGVQTFTVPAGGGLVFDLICDIPGEFPFVNHAFGHGQKGAIGILHVE